MDVLTFVLLIMGGGMILVMVLTIAHGNAVESGLTEKFGTIPDFTPSVSYSSSSCRNAIALDVERKKIAVILNPMKIMQLEARPSVYSFNDLLAVEVVKDGGSILKTQRGSQIAGAAIGGVLLGPAGLIVGGLSGKQQNQNRIAKLSLKLYTNDLLNPLQEVFFMDFAAPGADPQQVQPILRDFEQWHARLRAIVAAKAAR